MPVVFAYWAWQPLHILDFLDVLDVILSEDHPIGIKHSPTETLFAFIRENNVGHVASTNRRAPHRRICGATGCGPGVRPVGLAPRESHFIGCCSLPHQW